MQPRWFGAVFGLVACLPAVFAADDYKLSADSYVQPDVPRGQVTKHTWKSQIFPNTTRDYWVYVPAQYNPQHPAAVMVFQDGGAYVNDKGDFRTTVVFDNLIHQNQMPVTIGIFINPGTFPGKDKKKHPQTVFAQPVALLLALHQPRQAGIVLPVPKKAKNLPETDRKPLENRLNNP